MNRTTHISALVLLVVIQATAFGRLGESAMQCFKRYGRITEEKNLDIGKQIKFQSDKFTVTAIFVADKAQFLKFTKSSVEDLSAAEVRTILEKNGMDMSVASETSRIVPLGNSMGKEFRWTSPDLVAVLSAIGSVLYVSTATFVEKVSGSGDAAQDAKELENF
jgi:hypothetical protein